ncbi:hypothetical protein [Ascidiaceihabitans sp.]|uniref:hypothetical protein n=1 Tax=Ascidiaceihabitans sp. TaxID=1872644 RepID=UPI00329702D7
MILQPHRERASSWLIALSMSTAVHAGAFVYAFDLLPFGVATPPIPAAFPQIEITNVVMQPETPLATPEVETPEPVDPSAAEALQPEALAAVEPDPVEAVEPETAAPVDEAEQSDLEPEALAAVEPEDTATAIEPEDTTAALEPENLSPVLPEDGAVLQGATVAPTTPIAPERIAAVAPAAGEVVGVVTTAPRVGAVNAIPDRPAPTPVAQPAAEPPSPEDLALLEVIDRIRTRFGDRCLVALPQSGGATPSVVLVSDQDRTMATFEREVLSDPNLPVDVQNLLVDARQCAAVEFARARAAYPLFKVDLQLRSRDVASGERLIGTIGNVGGRYTSLLLVDDNGVVQDLRRFTRFVGSSAEFDIPVTRDGSARDTSQLLVVLTTPGRPETVTNLSGRLAEDFFGPLDTELGTQGQIAILPFFVR